MSNPSSPRRRGPRAMPSPSPTTARRGAPRAPVGQPARSARSGPLRRVAVLRAALLCVPTGLLAPAQDVAAAPYPGAGPRPDWQLRTSLAVVRQGEADLDRGGDYAADTVLLRFGAARPLGPRLVLGFDLDLDHRAYDFSTPPAFGGAAPWDDGERISLGMSIRYRLSDRWGLFAAPSLGSQVERGASLSGGTIAGGIVGAAAQVGPDLRLGIGAGAFRGLEETRFFVFPQVDWRIGERLRLANPLRASATGPAGLELQYGLAPGWTLGGGGAWRSFRFRLDDDGPAPDGIGEDTVVLTWLRVSREWQGGTALDLYAGAGLDGRLDLEDDRGKLLIREDYETAPLLAVALRTRF